MTDDIFASCNSRSSNGCSCMQGLELFPGHEVGNEVVACNSDSTVIACGDCELGAAEAEGADWS